MRRLVVIFALLLAAPMPVAAQTESDEVQEGLDLLTEGARRLLEELTEELSPFLRQLEMQLDELQAYEAPEILPNGDILIRRKPDPEGAPTPPEPAPEGEEDAPIDL